MSKTLPSGRSVADPTVSRAVLAPGAAKVSVEGSYNSMTVEPPPAIRTLPFWSRVAVWPDRGVVILPVALKVPGDCPLALKVLSAAASKRRSQRCFWLLVGVLNAIRSPSCRHRGGKGSRKGLRMGLYNLLQRSKRKSILRIEWKTPRTPVHLHV